MDVEIVRCSACEPDETDDGIGDGVARAILEGVSEGVLDATYQGFFPKDLPGVLKTVLAGLPGRDIPIPSAAALAANGAPPEAMAAFLGGVPSPELKLVVFDAGREDADEWGYTAFTINRGFDTRVRLDEAGFDSAVIDLRAAPPRPV